MKVTKFPTCLNKCNFRVVEKKWDGTPEEVWLRLEISIENGHIVALFDIAMFHAFSQSTCFVSIPVVPYLILYVYAFA